MNRRGFFKALGAAGLIAASTPAAFVAVASQTAPSGLRFKRHWDVFDYGYKVGLAARLDIGDDIYRHAIALPMNDWANFTEAQRERTWKFVERKTYEFAMKRRNS